MGQTPSQGSAQGDAAAPEAAPTAFSASEVSSEVEETTALIQDAILSSRQPKEQLGNISNWIAETEERVKRLVEKTESELESELPLNELRDLRSTLQRGDTYLRQWRNRINSEARTLEDLLGKIRERRVVWEITEEASREDDYPRSVRQTIDETLKTVNQGREEVAASRSHLLDLQNSIIHLRGLIHDSLVAVSAASHEQRRALLSFDGPPLWDFSQIDTERIWPRFRDQLVRSRESLADYVVDELYRVLLTFLMLAGTIILLLALKRKFLGRIEREKGLPEAELVLSRPIASAIVITSILNHFIHPNGPLSWFDAGLLIRAAAVVRLLPALAPPQLLVFTYLLIGLRAIEPIYGSVPAGSSLGRVLTISITVAALSGLYLFRNRLQSAKGISPAWRSALSFFSWGGVLLLAIGLISGIFGNLALTRLLVGGTIRVATTWLFLWIGVYLLCGLVELVLQTSFAAKLRFVRGNQDLISHKAKQLLGVLATVAALGMVLPKSYSVFDPIADEVMSTLTKDIPFGAMSFSLYDVLLFVFMIWISFKTARLICFILDEDFLPRLRLPRGAPNAISRLTYYAILFFGFVVALAATGVELSRFALLGGAFGVGIGFGLQNVVNNFVSGLILLFERPIQLGDKIELSGGLFGEVTHIGIRASVVKTFDGAEVLVPNGDLISTQMTNWTLSDRRRRIIVPIGVKYGTDPEQVISILKKTAVENPNVLSNPEPSVFFMEHGDSALLFSLRAWVGRFEIGFEVRSELTVAVNKALNEAGIEIPFPQRDLHLRSVDSDIKFPRGKS